MVTKVASEKKTRAKKPVVVQAEEVIEETAEIRVLDLDGNVTFAAALPADLNDKYTELELQMAQEIINALTMVVAAAPNGTINPLASLELATVCFESLFAQVEKEGDDVAAAHE